MITGEIERMKNNKAYDLVQRQVHITTMTHSSSGA